MRLWSLHPKYLDVKGLVALWREGLLAQAVLRGRTKGYVEHPQLWRFRERASPVGSIADYLRVIRAEAARRGYRFASDKVSRARARGRMTVSRGQLLFEWRHLLQKLGKRDPIRYAELAVIGRPQAHPLFRVVAGGIARWEKGGSMTRVAAKDIDAYIDGFAPDVRKKLESVRRTIRAAAPQAREKISYQIPTFTLRGNLVHFAAFKNHIGFYPGSEAIKAFESRLKRYKSAKGSVQFPLDRAVPLGLITAIVKFRVKASQKAR
jgi:uncharacterized protein YdhG (YjbR/CyaY superfamily)